MLGVPEPEVISTPLPEPTPAPTVEKAERVSETNVQVPGIDEPDIVKTDGENIYFAQKWWRYPVIWEGKYRHTSNQKTKVIKAFPPESLKIDYEIDKSGELLLYNKTLIIFGHDRIYGFDVSEGDEKWKVELNSSLISARLYASKIYLITRSRIDFYDPCPIRPLSSNGIPVIIDCPRIYYPIQPVPVDVTYNVMILDAETGKVEKSMSFLGLASSSVVYMSQNAIYITYSYYADVVKFTYEFMKENRDLIPSSVIERVEELLDYDISNRAKQVELQVILEQYSSSLSKDDRLKFRNEYWNRFYEYQKEHKRELEKTGIAKISLNLELLADGKVPGRILNQFALDEYDSYLRIATTIGFGDSTNDVYVLDEELNTVGSIKDFGEGERIYAVRFLGDKGYVVTFRQTDPFFVMDLSNPRDPELKGELKIPGYSSYLHPITDKMILGIGKEDQYVKISLFDVSSAENPEEIDKYILEEYWSDILSTHHAFLIDKKHEIFFLPASKGGYIFSYKDGLELLKAVDVSALRAIYIDDYLYIVGDRLIVLDENTWEKVNEMELIS
jgi:uncharacterized secreted protein with C-terminal beta-propeller domain